MILHPLKRFIPDFIKAPINRLRNTIRWERQFKKIINFYDNKPDCNSEEEEVINYLKNIGGLVVFPYEYTNSWDYMSVEVFFDNASELNYVLHDKKKLYFKRGMSEIEIKGIYFGLINEQSPKSPHLYLTDSFTVENGSIVADFGAAEGIFSLNVIELVSKIYLFEPDSSWIEALEHTFKPWAEKVTIVNKFVDRYVTANTITIDQYFSNVKIDFIKADIEGAEMNMLIGASTTLASSDKLKVAITTYHKQEDFDYFSKLLSSRYNFSIEHSYGYMLYFINNNLKPPYLRRGVLRAEKNVAK